MIVGACGISCLVRLISEMTIEVRHKTACLLLSHFKAEAYRYSSVDLMMAVGADRRR